MHIGKFYLEINKEKDFSSAYKWFIVGAALGLDNSIEMRDDVEKELSPEDIIEGQDSAEDLFNKFVIKSNKN